MKRLTLTLTAVFCLLLSLSVTHPVAAKDTWTSVRSKNFFLIGNASEKEIRQVAMRLEQFREVSSRLFTRININSPVPTTVVVFKSDGSYRPFKPNANTAGYFQAGLDVNYITLTTEQHGDQDPFGIIFHEYTHLLVNNTASNVPTWLNEGLAEYYSTFSITDDQKVVLGKPIANHVFLLRDNKMLPLRTLFQVDQQSAYYNERDKQSIFYAESWALMHYLILGNQGRRLQQLGRFLQLMDTSVPMEQAFQQAFETSFENMEKELREYIKRDRYPVIPGRFESKLGFDSEMQAAPVSEAEVQAYLGDLLLHSYRADAETYLQRALTLDPQLAMANASMGMLRVRQGKIDEARQSLERAVAANSRNYLIHYYYAFALSREGMNEMQVVTGYAPATAARIREELKKAIELRPDYPESYSLLAFINLVTETQLDESIDLLKRVLATSPGRNDLLFVLAQVYLHKQDYKTARQILDRLSQNKSDARLRQQAQSLFTQVVSREEQIARFEARRNSKGESDQSGSQGPAAGPSAPDSEPNKSPFDTSSSLQEALRKPAGGERRVQGSLVRIECDAKGITFVIKVDERVVKLHTDRFENIQIVAFTREVGGEITCGLRKPENPVVICYLPTTEARSRIEGTLKSIEFVPQDFKLKERPG